MAELKHCPFCGGKAVFLTKNNRSTSSDVGFDFVIRCEKCRATTPASSDSVVFQLSDKGEIVTIDDGRGKAIEAWNRRAEDGK